ncbi:hypothetical protein STEG23_011695 [Scotinomys teguina]
MVSGDTGLLLFVQSNLRVPLLTASLSHEESSLSSCSTEGVFNSDCLPGYSPVALFSMSLQGEVQKKSAFAKQKKNKGHGESCAQSQAQQQPQSLFVCSSRQE